MGWRFHKSFKLFPGVRVNVGKKRISSLSVGPRGAKLNINKKGTKLTTSIPGTGISHTTQLTQRLDVPSGKSSTVCPFCAHHMRKAWDNCPKCKQALIKNITPEPARPPESPIIDTEDKEINSTPLIPAAKKTVPPSKGASCLGYLVIVIILSLISSCLFGGDNSKKGAAAPSSTSSVATTSIPTPAPVATATQKTQEAPPPAKPATNEKAYYGAGPNGEGIKGHIDKKKGTMIYHLPGDPYYGRTTHVSQWFFTEKEAQSAGYRHIYH